MDLTSTVRTPDPTSTYLKDLVQAPWVHCSPQATVAEAAEAMRTAGCGSVLITEDGAPVGIWTEHDALRLNLTDPGASQQLLATVMSAPIHSASADTTAAEAQARMEEAGLRHLLVTEPDGGAIGVVSQTDLIHSHGIETYLRLREVRTALEPGAPTLPASSPLSGAVRRMADTDQSAAVVAFDTGERGIVTERDVVRVLATGVPDPPLHEVASRPLITVSADDTLLTARERMLDQGIRRVGVTDEDGNLLGLVGFAELMATSETGLIRHLEASLEATRSRLSVARRSERRFEAIREQAPVGLLGLDRHGVICDANAMAGRLLGAATESLAGRSLAGLLDAGASLDQELTALGQGYQDRIQHEATAAPGPAESTGRWLEITASPLRDDSGHPDGASVVLSDITARKEAQHREAEARQYYEQMFRKNTAPKLLIDPESGYIADANPAALDFYGYSLEAIQNQRIQDINQLSEEEVRAEWERAHREERRYFEFRHRLADGDLRDVKVYSGPMEVGGHPYLHSIIHDVTEAKRYLASLEDYKAIFEALPVGVYRNRPGKEGYFAEANPAMARIFGASSVAELLRHPTAELYRDPTERKRFSDDLLAQGEVHGRELALQTLDGEPIWGAITARVRQATDGSTVFDGALEDITERKAAEAALAHERGVGEALRRILTELVYEASPPAILFDRVCRIAVEAGGFRLAWIGRLDANDWLRPEAWAGSAPEYLEGLSLSRDPDRAEGQGPAGTALRQGEPVVIQDLDEAPSMDLWRAKAEGLGLWGAAVLPFRHGGRIVGSLQVYAPTRDFFSDSIIELLRQAGQAIGFALDSHERWTERDQLIDILEATPDFVSIAQPDGTLEYVNQGGRSLVGLPPSATGLSNETPEEVREGETAGQWGHPDWAATIIGEEGIPTAMSRGYWEGETALVDAEGREIPVSQVILAHHDERGEVTRLSTIMRDISQQKALQETLAARQQALSHLQDITGDPQRELEDKIRAILQLGADTFGLPYAILSHVSGDDYGIRQTVTPDGSLAAGQHFDLGVTYCPHTLAADAPTGFPHVAESAIRDHPGYRTQGMEAYLGIPVRAGNTVYGTLNFSSPEPRSPYSDFEWQLLKLMGQWVSYELTREANRQALERERNLFIGGPTVVLVWRREAGWPVEYVSPNIEADFGHTPNGLQGHRFDALLHPEDRERVAAEVADYIDRDVTSFEQEFRLQAGDGSYRWVYVFTVPNRDTEGAIEGFHGYMLDITDRRALEAEQRLLAMAFHTSQALIITDPNGTIERVNPAFTTITGYTPEEAIGRNPSMLASGHNDAAFYRALWHQLTEHGHWEGEIWNRRKSGEIYPEWESISAVANEAGEVEHYVAVFHDISEQKRLEAELERLATHDRLTGIYNRAKLYELLEAAHAERERYGTPFAVIMFDIDHFKTINDRLGHHAGDDALRELTRRIGRLLRETDAFGRWGGEEFLVLTSHSDASAAAHLAERIRAMVAAEPFGGVGPITISLGVAEAQTGEDLERLEERADDALYAAKAAGRNTIRMADQGI